MSRDFEFQFSSKEFFSEGVSGFHQKFINACDFELGEYEFFVVLTPINMNEKRRYFVFADGGFGFDEV